MIEIILKKVGELKRRIMVTETYELVLLGKRQHCLERNFFDLTDQFHAGRSEMNLADVGLADVGLADVGLADVGLFFFFVGGRLHLQKFSFWRFGNFCARCTLLNSAYRNVITELVCAL